MTSACINNPHLDLSPEKFLDHPPTYSSFAGEMHEQGDSSTNRITSPDKLSDPPEESDPDVSDVSDFEFRLEEPVNMLPADQLFSDGKLFPLHFPVIHPEVTSTSSTVTDSSDVRCSDTREPSRIINGVSVVDSFLFSHHQAPKCSSKWKELLGLRKLYQNSKTASSPSSGTGTGNTAIKSIKHFLYRSSKSPTDSSINLPLLNDADSDPASVPARHSLSSSSSGHDPDDLPRLSLDSEKPLKVYLNSNPNPNNPPRMKLVKTRTLSSDGSIRAVSTESPRMNSSGKIVFHSLERSSSSPSSFTGGSRSKHRGMERSYSGNVRITPVLNVPVCSLRGFPLFSSSQKNESSSNSNKGANNRQQMNNKSKTDRS
ncbi:hypothetical protein R6Q59_009564 [Mikania micrantha]|uniref:Uncharacterized protein n=1 Tax=Mikania micrantha TaxID=192012 RepID=A0A5N6N9L9_9ASTR|nr:hypothetical protein E3N88_26482 [Mikania micrantha]